MATTTFKWPKSLAECADLLYTMRETRIVEQKKVNELEAKEKALKEHLINTLPKSMASGIAGKIARVTINKEPKPVVQDWDKFYAYVRKTGSFDMLQRRLTTAAIEARWEEKKTIPGVGKFDVITVSINKV